MRINRKALTAVFMAAFFALAFFTACSDDDDDDSSTSPEITDDDTASPDDDVNDDLDDDADDDVNDDVDDDVNDDVNDDADDDTEALCPPYWTYGDDYGPADIMIPGDQGANSWELPATLAAKDALLASDAIKFAATYLTESDEYVIWTRDGEQRFTRTIGDEGYEYNITQQTGDDPFPNVDPMYAPDYETELSLYENPNSVQMTQLGYAADDPRVGFLPLDSSYPYPYQRLTQLFDTPNAPDLVFGHYNAASGSAGTHGAMSLSQSRATLIFSGAGAKSGQVLEMSARHTDIAPTVLAFLGADVGEGVDDRGHAVSNTFLKWQDGRVLTEVMEDECAARPMADYAVILDFDGLNSNEMIWLYENPSRHGYLLPHFTELMQSGVIVRGGAVVGFPSISSPGHTNIGTGAWPGRHGIINNSFYLRDTQSVVSGKYITDDILEVIRNPQLVDDYYDAFYHGDRVETIFEAAHRSFGDWELWPPDWRGAYFASINELYYRGADYSYIELGKLLNAIVDVKAQSGILDDYMIQIADALVTVQFSLIFSDPTHDFPKIVGASFYMTDHDGEGYGPHSDMVRRDMEQADARVGLLMDLYRQAGIFDRTLWVLTSDHGMELQDPSRFESWRQLLESTGLKYVAPMKDVGVYFMVMRVESSVESLPADTQSQFTVTVADDDLTTPVAGAVVTLNGGSCVPCVETTGDDGTADFTITPAAGENVAISAAHDDYCAFEGEIAVE